MRVVVDVVPPVTCLPQVLLEDHSNFCGTYHMYTTPPR
jgi:hypothetical protein